MAKGIWLKTKLNVKVNNINVSDISGDNATLSGFEAIFPEVERWYNSFNQTELMKAIAEVVDYIVQENFIQQGRPEKWAEWSPAWAYRRTQKPYNKSDGMKLQLTGVLRNSLTYTDLNNDSFKYGTNVEYAARQNDGGGGIPARPFLVIPETDYNLIVETIMEFFGI